MTPTTPSPLPFSQLVLSSIVLVHPAEAYVNMNHVAPTCEEYGPFPGGSSSDFVELFEGFTSAEKGCRGQRACSFPPQEKRQQRRGTRTPCSSTGSSSLLPFFRHR